MDQQLWNKIEEYRAKGFEVPDEDMIKTPEQIEGIRKACEINTKVLDEVAKEGGNFVIAKVNVDENVEIAKEYGISAIPTLLVFKNGELKNKAVGVLSKQEILDLLKI